MLPNQPKPFYRDRRFLVWFIPVLVIEIFIASKLTGRTSLLFNLAIVLVTSLVIEAIPAIRSRSSRLSNASASTRRTLRRHAVTLLTLVGLLPISIILAWSDSKHGQDFLLDVFATDIVIGGAIGFVAMVCAFIVAAIPEETWSNRLMGFGAGLAYWAFLSILLYGVVAGVPPQ